MLNQEFNEEIQPKEDLQLKLVDELQSFIETDARMSGQNVLDTLRTLVNQDLLNNPASVDNLFQILEEKSKTLKYSTAISLLTAIEKQLGCVDAEKRGEIQVQPRDLVEKIYDMRTVLSENFREPPRLKPVQIELEPTNQ